MIQHCSKLVVPLLVVFFLGTSVWAQDMYDSGASNSVNQQINQMWATFGRGENVRLTAFGNEPGWYEWMARKHCWSDTPKSREKLRDYLVNWPQSTDGYIWTWGTEEGWPTHHVRHNENNGKYIMAVCKYYNWQGGKSFLDSPDKTTTMSTQPNQTDVSEGLTVLEKLRAAMDYQLTTLHGDSGLAIITDPRCDGTVDGMPSDYWDNLRFGYKSAYLNIYFYGSLVAMADLEESLGQTARALTLRSLAQEVKAKFSETFWHAKKGRFIGCVDVTGRKWDFGFTYLNLEAITYGLANKNQAAGIFEWLDGRRIIGSDKQKVGSRITGATGDEIYSLGWAPVSNTRAIESIKVDGKYWWWHLGNRITVDDNASYGEHLENGGAIFYVSHYDLMARLETFGPDNAWQRFEAILAEHRKDGLKRDPGNNRGIDWKWGIIGEFPESGLVPASVALGFMGLDASAGELVINPQLPTSLPWLEVKHVNYLGGVFSIKSDEALVRIKTIEGTKTTAQFRIRNGQLMPLPEIGNEVFVRLK